MKRILLIEDDTVLRQNTAELLELSGYQVVTAPDGKAGVELAKSRLPDMVICDIIMPHLNGYSVLEMLSKDDTTKHIPFIFLSAKTEKHDIRKGMNLGADDYILKPFDEDELLTAIKSRMAKAAINKEYREAAEPPKNTLIQSLDELKEYIAIHGTSSTFKKGEVVYTEQQNQNWVYLLTKGVVKCHKLDEQGKELITALYNEKELFGITSFENNTLYQETATAIKDAEIVAIPKQELKHILDKNHEVMFEFIRLMADDLAHVKDRLLQMAYSSVNKKTAATILAFAEKLNHNMNDPIKISRNDLASVAGISPETLIRAMAELKKQGIIEIERRNIKVVNLQKLKESCL
ncbi:MAG TPA: response regulator [Flavobacteriaceae bacterium]|nr:response regulator [Flavobacteriaceae bacterium]